MKGSLREGNPQRFGAKKGEGLYLEWITQVKKKGYRHPIRGERRRKQYKVGAYGLGKEVLPGGGGRGGGEMPKKSGLSSSPIPI